MHKEFDGAILDPCPDDSPEDWKYVVGYEWLYSVSSHGRVRGEARTVTHSHGGPKRLKERIMRQKLNRGYPQVQLSCDGVQSFYSVHRLVAEAFIGSIRPDMTVNHLDGDKTNNRVSNLEIVTMSENIRHAIRTGLRVPASGESHYHSTLTADDVIEIRRRAKSETRKAIAASLGVSPQCVGKVVRGDTWSMVPGASAPIDMRGETNRMAKLSEAAVSDIRARAGSTSQRALAIEYGVSESLVSMVVRGVVWRHLLPPENGVTATQ